MHIKKHILLLLFMSLYGLSQAQPNITDSIYINMKKCDVPAAFLTMHSTRSAAIFAIRGAIGVVGANGPNTDIKLFRLSSTFDTLWSKQFGGSKNDAISSINELPNGHLLLSGTTESSDGDVWYGNSNWSKSIWLLEVDTLGNFVKGKVLGSSVGSWGTQVYVTPWGDMFVTGLTNGGDFDMAHPINSFETHGFIFKLDSMMNIRWRKFHTGDPGSTQGIIHLTSSNNIEFYYTSYTNDSSALNMGQDAKGNGDVLITKIDSSGTILWRKRFGGSLEDGPIKLVFDSTNNVIYLVGNTESEDKDITYRTGQNSVLSGGYWNIWVLKIDTAGNVLYSKAYGGNYSIPYGANTMVKDALMYNGKLWVFAEELGGGGDLPPNNGTNQNAWIAKFDDKADLRASYPIMGSGHDRFLSAIMHSGFIYVSGGSYTYNGAINTYSCDTSKIFSFVLGIGNAPLHTTNSTAQTADWSIYPNPVQNELTILLPAECEHIQTTITLLSVDGKVLAVQHTKDSHTKLRVQGLPVGHYTVQIKYANTTHHKQFSIQ